MLRNLYQYGVDNAYKEEGFLSKVSKYTATNYGGLFGGSNLNNFN